MTRLSLTGGAEVRWRGMNGGWVGRGATKLTTRRIWPARVVYLGGMLRPTLLCLLFLPCTCALAQGPISGFVEKKGEIVTALSYGREHYDEYFLPDDGVEDRVITTVSYSLFAEAAFSDNTALVVTLPYMQTNDGAGSLQDASLWLKYANVQKRAERAVHNVITAVGLSFPIGGYEVTGPEAIGQRAGVFQGRLTYQFQHDDGWFLSAQSGIDFQFSPESASAWPLLLRGGYGSRYFYLEGWLEFITSLDGGATVMGAATGTGSSWRRLGGTAYFPLGKRLGVTLAGAQVLSGSFIGDSFRWSTGVVVRL